MTVKELKARCKELGIKGYSKLRKGQLLQVIEKELRKRAEEEKGKEEELLIGAELMKRLPEEENLDSIAAVDREKPRAPKIRELPKDRERPFMGRRGYCATCGSFDIMIRGTDDWCADCGSHDLAWKKDFHYRLEEAEKAVDEAIFGDRENFLINYEIAVMACREVARPRRVRERRRVISG